VKYYCKHNIHCIVHKLHALCADHPCKSIAWLVPLVLCRASGYITSRISCPRSRHNTYIDSKSSFRAGHVVSYAAGLAASLPVTYLTLCQREERGRLKKTHVDMNEVNFNWHSDVWQLWLCDSFRPIKRESCFTLERAYHHLVTVHQMNKITGWHRIS